MALTWYTNPHSHTFIIILVFLSTCQLLQYLIYFYTTVLPGILLKIAMVPSSSHSHSQSPHEAVAQLEIFSVICKVDCMFLLLYTALSPGLKGVHVKI